MSEPSAPKNTSSLVKLQTLTLHSSETRKPRHSVSAAGRLRFETNEVVFIFQVQGEIAVDSKDGDSQRRDELWKKTCFESFISGGRTSFYREWNFAPHGDWAAYDFTGYREGMAKAPILKAPTLQFFDLNPIEQPKVQRWEFCVGFDPELASEVELSLTAVIIEPGDFAPFYWAPTHVGHKPDFHRRESFKLKLEI